MKTAPPVAFSQKISRFFQGAVHAQRFGQSAPPSAREVSKDFEREFPQEISIFYMASVYGLFFWLTCDILRKVNLGPSILKGFPQEIPNSGS